MVKKIQKIWSVNVDNILVSKLSNRKTDSKYFIEYLDKFIRPLILILPIMGGYVKTFKVEDRGKDKNNKLIFFRIDDSKLLVKYRKH